MLNQKSKSYHKGAAENDLLAFIRLIAPNRVLGAVHEELITWWTREDAKDHQLVLLPRDHQKSVLLAYRVVWEITRDPTTTVLYLSATSTLAEKQLYFIKNTLTSKLYRQYWPEMVDVDNIHSKNTIWNVREIVVDHPLRKEENVRDPTIFAAGLTTNVTGMHFRIAALDDVVIQENAYSRDAREKVKSAYSLLSSVQSAGMDERGRACEWVVGTRYHVNDLYNDMIQMKVETFDKDGAVTGEEDVYEVFERQVESAGDGSGEYLWPRQQRYDGKWFGFDQGILANKRAKYLDKRQFRAQYYNNPNDPGEEAINSTRFQYYDRDQLYLRGGRWFIKNKILNVYAAIDFAFSLKDKADYTAIVVIGVTPDNNIYILDIDRFKSDRISDYYERIVKLHNKWNIKKLRAEVNSGQQVIVRQLKELYLQPNGIFLSIDEHRSIRNEGTKEERIATTLEPRYENLMVWHYKGGNCQILEDELKQHKPAHDDVKDALAAAVAISKPPREVIIEEDRPAMKVNSRFGGIVR